MQANVERWDIVGPLPGIAGHLTLSQTQEALFPKLSVTLRFSRKKSPKDLRIVFDKVVRYDWRFDGWIGYSFAPDSKSLPEWVFVHPMFTVPDSPWSAECNKGWIAPTYGYGNATHYVIMSHEGILEILAFPDVSAEWIAGEF